MPQGKNSQKSGNASRKKKGGGRTPAHQNKFAFQHNPKSKLTDKILASPNVGACRRCHDKIEWRKKYRKYKPRTQPGRCNICSRRNVSAAYHTICGGCARGEKALKAVREAMVADEREAEAAGRKKQSASEEGKGEAGEDSAVSSRDCDADGEADASAREEKDDVATPKTSVSSSQDQPRRACAVCVRALALGSTSDVSNDKIAAVLAKLSPDANRPLKLREKRALERKLERLREEEKERRKAERRADRENEEGENETEDSESGDDVESVVGAGEDEDSDTEEEDPFLKAIGGADKLATGGDYQRMLMERERKQAGLSAGAGLVTN